MSEAHLLSAGFAIMRIIQIGRPVVGNHGWGRIPRVNSEPRASHTCHWDGKRDTLPLKAYPTMHNGHRSPRITDLGRVLPEDCLEDGVR